MRVGKRIFFYLIKTSNTHSTRMIIKTLTSNWMKGARTTTKQNSDFNRRNHKNACIMTLLIELIIMQLEVKSDFFLFCWFILRKQFLWWTLMFVFDDLLLVSDLIIDLGVWWHIVRCIKTYLSVCLTTNRKRKKKNEEKVLAIPLRVYKSNNTNQKEICKLIDLSNLLVKSSAFRFAFRMVLYLVHQHFWLTRHSTFFGSFSVCRRFFRFCV